MKILILSGPGEAGKRAEALRIRKQFERGSVSLVDFKQQGLEQLKLQLLSPSLFETGKRLVVVESVSEKLDLQDLGKGGEDLYLLILADNLKQDCTLLQSAKKLGAKAMVFEGEKELSAFPFLDALLERKNQAFIELENLLEEYGGVYVLTMIYYALRRNNLPLPASSFARKKILAQKALYSSEEWEKLYYLALKLDFQIKSGLTSERLGLTQFVQVVLNGDFE